jgi:GxxExxY protein
MSILTESDPRTYSIIGAAMEVHSQLGCGFLEPIYQAALEIEFADRAIPFRPQEKFRVYYKGFELDEY